MIPANSPLMNPLRQPHRGVVAMAVVALSVLWLLSSAAVAGEHDNTRSDLLFGRGLLWRIETQGAAASYLFGTIHSGDKHVAQLPAPVKSSFDRSDVFVMEVIPDAGLSAKMRAAMRFPHGHELKGVVSDKLYRQAVKDMAQYDVPEDAVNRLEPWAIATTLSVPETETGPPLDVRLYQMARDQKKSIFGLETAAEQIAVLHNMSLNDQVELLRGAVDTFDERFKIYRSLIRDYLSRDLAAIVELNKTYTRGNRHLAREMDKRIFLDRNKRMVKRIIPHLKAGGAFIAVGAGHLPGRAGVLNLLRGQGYDIERVY